MADVRVMKKQNRLDTLVWINEQKEGQAREKVMLLSERHQGLENQRQALKEAYVRCEANGKKAVMWEVAQAAARRLVSQIESVEQELEKSEKILEEARLHHQKTYADLKAVLRLRDNRLLELKQVEDKKEQKVMDDLAVMMFARKAAS